MQHKQKEVKNATYKLGSIQCAAVKTCRDDINDPPVNRIIVK